MPPSVAAQVVHSAGRRFIVSPVPEARLREPLFGPPSANTSFEDSTPGLIYTSAEKACLNILQNIQTDFIHPFSFPASDPTSASSVQQEQVNFAPGSTQISVVPATPGGLAPESCIAPTSQSLYPSPVPTATANLITVTTQEITPTPSTTTQQTSTGRTSPSPAPTESPEPRRLSSPTPFQTPQNIVGQQAESSGLDQTQATIQQVQVGPSSIPVTQPTGTDGEGDVQGKPPGIEDIHALDKKLRSLFKDSSQSSSTQPDGSGEPSTSSPPNTITPGLVSSVTPPSLSLSSSGNFAPGAFASVGTPTSHAQTSSADPSPQRPQVGEVANSASILVFG